jgi:Transposase DDE domain group 1
VPTTDCIAQTTLKFQGQKRQTEVAANAPTVSSDGGALALRRLDDAMGLTKLLAAAVGDTRNPHYVVHSRQEQLRQRIYQIALGYEDCNDAEVLRHDPLLQVVCTEGALQPLSSQPTLSRLENAISGERVRAAWCALEELYVASLARDSTQVVLDIDSTDDPTHGEQQLAFFHGFYDQHMFHPLLVFDGDSGELISAILRPGRAHAAWSAEGLLRRLIRAIRARCPHAAVVVRGDSGFAMPWLLDALDELHKELGDVFYVLGLAKNPRLLALAAPTMALAAPEHRASEGHVRRFQWLDYAAQTWLRERKVVLKAEHADRGQNPRFVVTNVDWVDPRSIYDGAYCPRGQAENYIKDLKNALRADRLSCHRFVANALRLLLHAAAYRLMHALRTAVRVVDPALGRAQMDTLRLRLLKVAAVVRVSVRRVRVALSQSFAAWPVLAALLASSA